MKSRYGEEGLVLSSRRSSTHTRRKGENDSSPVFFVFFQQMLGRRRRLGFQYARSLFYIVVKYQTVVAYRNLDTEHGIRSAACRITQGITLRNSFLEQS